jgi:type VI secretion system protein ImpE
MKPDELLRAGDLQGAIQAAVAEVRDHPTDSRRRTFLFELLCFAGEFSRAGKHLSVLAQAGPDAETGALLYRSALAAENKRQAFFEARAWADSAGPSQAGLSGTINGRPFHALEDADPRIGPRLEIFVAGEYLWLPFEHIGTIQIPPPKLLRDLIWSAARVTTGPSFKGQEFGEVLAPVLCPFSWKHSSGNVRLGRATEWLDDDSQGEFPVGQKLLIIDGEEAIPFLEIREITFTSATPDASVAS